MSERSTQHATFVIEREYAATPSRVFAAWSDPTEKAKWFAGPPDWPQGPYELDFRIGGRERASGGPVGGAVNTYEATYRDIVPNERIVHVYDMYLDDTRTSVSLATVELKPRRGGTHLTYTEQTVFLDGYDSAHRRELGTRQLLDALGSLLERRMA